MNPQHLARRLVSRKLAADRLATDLILDCERAASGRNGKRVDPARWTDTDWRSYVRSATSGPPFASLDAEPLRRRSLSVASIPNS
jgi:hypothetical protein